MFSVVIPLFNKVDRIGQTIESVLSQSFTNFELLVVDDGSTDGSIQVVNTFNDPRLKLLSKVNGGVSSARNFGISRSIFPYIAFLDGDDLWHEKFLDKIRNLIVMWSECDIYASSYLRYVDSKPVSASSKKMIFSNGIINDYFDLQTKYFYPLVCSSAVVIKKDRFMELGMFNESLSFGEDLDMWFRLILNGKIAYVNEPLAIYNDIPDHKRAKVINVDNNIVFNLSHFERYENSNHSFKTYINKFKLNRVLKFYIYGVNNCQVQKLVNQIPTTDFSFSHIIIYKVLPKILLKWIYEVNVIIKKYKYLIFNS